ncbi:YD repeat-containing protein [Chryseobacterium oranimense]|uniref:YD repeat-containing protein n=1 Tax=Chryseobacterium oranimense TaxID=421058 RepID=A0A1M5J450_9FLAO|nr:hypothetical protein [Chryseobacterium oranimense]SHG35079.1 YD repeat-containing protein [Chryseobacterium oranimense]
MNKYFLYKRLKQLLFSIFFLSASFNSQVIKDSVLGSPKFVKEYVIFLNDSGPYTFMKGDNEYGHATIMQPENLRRSMRGTWFGTDFCRYINNETYYDKNRNITKETWYYKSGKIVDDYDYTYDNLNRLVTEKSKNDYSQQTSHYFYNKNEKIAKFRENYSKWKDEPMEKYVSNEESLKPLFVTKFDTITKTDSIFIVTNDIWKKNDNGSFSSIKDSIYHQKLSCVKIYDNGYKVIESKFFDHKLDYENKKIFLSGHMTYEYDDSGNLIKKTDIKDGKYHYYTILGNGKIIKEEKDGNYGKTMYTTYTYTKDKKLERETIYYNDKLWYDNRFEYKDNYITKLYYLDGNNPKNAAVVVFKYKFDKHKNWIEIIKNVNGKDLYKWVREIQYY